MDDDLGMNDIDAMHAALSRQARCLVRVRRRWAITLLSPVAMVASLVSYHAAGAVMTAAMRMARWETSSDGRAWTRIDVEGVVRDDDDDDDTGHRVWTPHASLVG